MTDKEETLPNPSTEVEKGAEPVDVAKAKESGGRSETEKALIEKLVQERLQEEREKLEEQHKRDLESLNVKGKVASELEKVKSTLQRAVEIYDRLFQVGKEYQIEIAEVKRALQGFFDSVNSADEFQDLETFVRAMPRSLLSAPDTLKDIPFPFDLFSVTKIQNMRKKKLIDIARKALKAAGLDDALIESVIEQRTKQGDLPSVDDTSVMEIVQEKKTPQVFDVSIDSSSSSSGNSTAQPPAKVVLEPLTSPAAHSQRSEREQRLEEESAETARRIVASITGSSLHGTPSMQADTRSEREEFKRELKLSALDDGLQSKRVREERSPSSSTTSSKKARLDGESRMLSNTISKLNGMTDVMQLGNKLSVFRNKANSVSAEEFHESRFPATLARVMKRFLSTPRIQFLGCSILEAFLPCDQRHARSLIHDCDLAEVLVPILKSSAHSKNFKLLLSVVTVLSHLAEPAANSQAFLNAGIIPGITKAIKQFDKSPRLMVTCLNIVRNVLSESRANAQDISDFASALVDLTRSEANESDAIKMFEFLCETRSYCEKMVLDGVCADLIRDVKKVPAPHAQLMFSIRMLLLASRMQRDASHLALRHYVGMDRTASNFRYCIGTVESNAEGAKLLFATVQNYASNPAICHDIGASTYETILKALNVDRFPPDLVILAVDTLALLVKDEENLSRLLRANLLDDILSSLRTQTLDRSILRSMLLFLLKLVQDFPNTKIKLINKGVAGPLKSIISCHSTDPDICGAAERILGTIFTSYKS